MMGGVVWGADAPFDGPSNYGWTGLMEVPTARVMKEGMLRAGVSQIKPYRSAFVVFSPFSFLEVDGRFTEIMGVPVNPDDPKWQGYGNYKDKVFGIKFQFLRESKYFPALALGIQDPHGTRLAASQYVVASKQIYPFDFTLGFGNGRYGKRPLPPSDESFKLEIFQDNTSWRTDGQFFGGIQFAASENIFLMAEYSPIKYDRLPGAYQIQAAKSPFSFGLRFRPWQWIEADLSYQRGDQLGINFSFSLDLTQPFLPLYDQPYREKKELRPSPLETRIVAALETLGFSNIRLRIKTPDIEIEAQNDRFYYSTRALGMALKALADILGEKSEFAHGDIKFTFTRNHIPIFTYRTRILDIVEYYREEFSLREYLSHVRWDHDERENLKVGVKARNWWDWGIRPSFQTFLNDPSGFFKYRFGGAVWLALNPWRGSSFVTGMEGYISNTISSVNAPSSQPVRTDSWLYLKENVNLNLLMYEQIEKLPSQFYVRFAGGILEMQYGGFDAEIARAFFGGRLLLGLSGSIVKKRETEEILKFKENDWQDYYRTIFLNTRLNIPSLEFYIDLKSGRFLAGDKGTRIQVSKFLNGVILSAWYSFTRTSMFVDNFNRGYHDKGISIVIPLRMFKGSDSRTTYYFAFQPWSRDVAQDIYHFTNLFDYMGRDLPIYLEKDIRIKGRGLQF
ncbi:MAG: YjbH domain-containing protein [Syntrophales bacterium]|nr:YjbH domain-containing protein [Syntrophales bacterium]